MSIVLYALFVLALLLVFGAIAYGMRRFGFDFLEEFVAQKSARVIGLVVVVVFFIGLTVEGVQVWAQNYHNKHWATCTVTRVTETSATKRVYTQDCGLLQVRDVNWQFNRHSGDTFRNIPNHGKVRLQIVGSRWSFSSWIPTVLDSAPVGEN